MSKISKELIESYRKIVLPFVSNQLCKADFEGQGEIDKTEFEQDFNEILDLAISSLNPSGDLISREALKETLTSETRNNFQFVCLSHVLEKIDNAQAVPLPNEQIAWEQGYEAGLAQGKNDRPQGEWVRKEDVIHHIAKQYSEHNELVPIWLSIGDMKGGAE